MNQSTPISARTGAALGAVRAADAMLRALGCCDITFRIPAGSAPANADLGLAGVPVQDVNAGPAVLRNVASEHGRHRLEVLLSASPVVAQVNFRDLDSALSFFDSALGVMHNDTLLRIESAAAEVYGGTPYLYRLVLTE